MPLPVDPLLLADHFIFPGSPPTSLKLPRIFLPIFQRDAVWDQSQICELWDSLLRGIPVPSLILAEYDSGIKVQETQAGTPVHPAPGDYFLIDGQQRARAVLTALERIFVDGSFANHAPRPLAQRLWLDLDWPHTADKNDKAETLDTHGLRFGFFLCTQSAPWGHNPERTGRPNSNKIRQAREILFKSCLEPDFQAGGSKAGCFDFELSLENTWPVEARCPVPFKDVLDHFMKAGPHSPQSWLSFLQGIYKIYAEQRTINHAGPHPPPTHLPSVANQLFHALPRLAKPGLTCIESDIDVDDLITAFQRINRNGTLVRNDELFFATIKKIIPSLYALAKQASDTLPPLDVVRGAVILATQPRLMSTSVLTPVSRRGNSPTITPPIELSPANLRSLEAAAMASVSGLPLSVQLMNALSPTPTSLKTALDELIRIIAYSSMPASDPGLPAVMFSRLKVTSWLPVLAWLIEWRKSYPQTALTINDRELLIRYLLMNHFFADWYPDEALMLRDLLDFVQDRARRGNAFPEVCEIRKHLDCYVKPNTGGAPAWLRKVDDYAGGHLVLPLTPVEWTRFLQNWVARPGNNGWLPDTNNYGGLLPGLADDLLMWSQRHVMDDWFKVHAKNIALFGKLGKPWDVDHIVPGSFFSFSGRTTKPTAGSPFLVQALSSNWLGLPSVKPHWNNISNIANRFGNKRLWPLGFNRSHGNISAKDKLSITWLGRRNSWDVLSYWPRVRASGSLILSASSIGNKLFRCWNLTPSNSRVLWNYVNLKAFLYATLASQRGREITIYRELFQILEPGLKCHIDWTNGACGDRMKSNVPSSSE